MMKMFKGKKFFNRKTFNFFLTTLLISRYLPILVVDDVTVPDTQETGGDEQSNGEDANN